VLFSSFLWLSLNAQDAIEMAGFRPRSPSLLPNTPSFTAPAKCLGVMGGSWVAPATAPLSPAVLAGCYHLFLLDLLGGERV
jgi:hypothetical protein